MNGKAAIVLLLWLAAGACFGVPSDVIYRDGEASVRYATGRVGEVAIGDLLDTGDTVTTGYDGFVELDQEGLTVKINPDTVFALQEKEQAGEKTGVLALVLGSIKFRFAKLTGHEPLVQTGACIAGVRGTEFSVFAGADGSSLIVVDSGLVEVEAAGGLVSLTADEGVEVRPGEAPGEKFKVQRDQIDYRTWNEQKIMAMLEDPELAVERLTDRLEYYIGSASEHFNLYTTSATKLEEERKQLSGIEAREGVDAARAYEHDVVSPIVDLARSSFLNYRYFALAALSLRRYVAGRLFIFMKARHIAGSADPAFAAFVDTYFAMLRRFEEQIVPRLVEVDI